MMPAAVAGRDGTALGTSVRLLVTDEAAIDVAWFVLECQLAQIDLACSRFRSDSELDAVNFAGGRAVEVSDVLLTAVEVALRAARLTDGAVDPTVGSALRRAGYDRDFAEMAKQGATVTLTYERVPGWEQVVVDRRAGTVRTPPGVMLDLGATAKALAADRAARAIQEQIAGGVLVSLGGDISVAGDPPAGGWVVRVSDDHAAPADAPGQTVTIMSGGLATSSTTVRAWERGDRRLHHLIDPATGAPADSTWRTVSVAAGSCVDANTASTAAIVMGDRAPAWLAAAGLPARLVHHDATVRVVGGWPAPETDAGAGAGAGPFDGSGQA